MKGFTLLELLVVMAVIAISTIFIIPNLGKSTDDQKLKNVAEELQTLIRQAQNNAQSGALCGSSRGSYWGVQFRRISATTGEGITYDLICGENRFNPTAIGSHGIPSGFIIEDLADKITCSPSSSITPLDSINPKVFVIFSNVKGAGNFGCYDRTNTASGQQNSCTSTPAAPCSYVNLSADPNHLLYSSAIKLTIIIKSRKTDTTKTVVIEKGGAVYVQ